MLSTILLLTLGTGEQRPDRVPHVQSVRAAVADLSRQLGRTVEVERALGSLPALIDLPGRAPSQRLDDLVFALRASLSRDGQKLRISRLAEDQNAVVALHRSAQRRVAELGLAKAEGNLKRYAALGGPLAQEQAAREAVARTFREADEARQAGRAYAVPPDLVSPGALTSASRTAVSLLRRIGPARLAERAPGEVRFWSDHPNAAESPLPPCADLLAEYRRRQGSYPTSQEEGEAVGNSAKILLRVEDFGASLDFFDAQGRRVDAGGVSYDNRAVVVGPNLPLLGAPGTVWRTLDETARSMASFLHNDVERVAANHVRAQAGDPPAPPPREFLDPERRDPLDFAVREGVLALLREPKTTGTIAILADWTIDLADECVRDGRLDATAFGRGLLKGGDYGRVAFERVAHNGVTALRPVDPLATEAASAHRAALGATIRRVLADGTINVRNWPAAHLALYASRTSPVTVRYLGALQGCGLRTFENIGSHDEICYALVGAALKSGRSIVDASLSPARAILRDGIVRDSFRLKPARGLSDLALAPSTLLASGALDHAQIGLAASEAAVAEGFGGLGDTKIGFVGQEPQQMGIDPLYPPGVPRTEARTKALFEARYLKPHYRLGRRIALLADVRLANEPTGRIELRDAIVDRIGLTFQQLPPAFRDAILTNVRKGLEGSPLPRLMPGDRVAPGS